MSKKSTGEALERYYARVGKYHVPRKNKKPEKEVEKACVEWMRAQGWDVGIYEAKAMFNPRAGRYVRSAMLAGTVDCQGVMPDGTFIAIEFKAKGMLHTFNKTRNHRQKEYLLNKISYNAFGCVVDSVDRLKEIYSTWANITDSEKRIDYLISSLP